ncbi:FAD-dependent oxidoreductase (plasmid) [Sinorhizobium meliloti]|nr:FAD-dependent oxidoreductase [Sinorhizobium meliloti]
MWATICGFIACGQLQVARTRLRWPRSRPAFVVWKPKGFTHETVIGGDEMRELVARSLPHCLGGAWVAVDGSADPHRTIIAFRDAALRAGVQIVEQCCSPACNAGPVDGSRRHQSASSRREPSSMPAGPGQTGSRAGGEPVQSIRTSMMVVTERTQARSAVVSSLGRKLSSSRRSRTMVIGGGSQGRLASDRHRRRRFRALAASVGAAVRLFPGAEGLAYRSDLGWHGGHDGDTCRS